MKASACARVSNAPSISSCCGLGRARANTTNNSVRWPPEVLIGVMASPHYVHLGPDTPSLGGDPSSESAASRRDLFKFGSTSGREPCPPR